MIDRKQVPDYWQVDTIDEVLIEAKNGGTPKRSNDEYWEGEIPWLSSGEISGKQLQNAEERITQKGLSESSASLFPKDSVLVAMYGDGDTKGRSVINRKEMSGNQAICCLVPDKNAIFEEYLLYYLKSIKRELRDMARGAGQDNLNQSIITSYEIVVPPLGEQEQIVEIIEKKLERVEQLKKSIESVRNLSKEYKDSVTSYIYANKEYDNDEAVVKTSSEGELPAHWEVKQIGDVVKYHSNLVETEKNKEYNLIELNDVEKGTGRIQNVQCESGGNIGSKKREFNENHVLYCKLRPYLNKVVNPSFAGIATSELLVLEPSDEITEEYLFRYLLSSAVRDRAESLMRGSNQPRIAKRDLMSFEMPVPPLAEQKNIVEELDRIDFNKIDLSCELLDSLFEEYRHSVLARAFQGGYTINNSQNKNNEIQNQLTDNNG